MRPPLPLVMIQGSGWGPSTAGGSSDLAPVPAPEPAVATAGPDPTVAQICSDTVV
jgi:hypothetical protein